MSTLNLLSKNYEPISNGAATEEPATFSDVVSAGFAMTRDNYNANSRARLVSDLQDQRASTYAEIEGKPLLGKNYSESNTFLSLGSTQDGAFSPLFETGILDFMRPDLWGMAQRLHKDDTYINLHIKELKEKDPEKYKNLLTNEEIEQQAREKAQASMADFQNVASRASSDSAFYGGIVGSLGGAMTDPINVLTMPIGASASSGVLRAIGTEAVVQAGVEAVTQPSVYMWQKELGQEYDLGDAAANVFGAAALGGAFTGVVRGARPTAQATFALMQKSSTFNSLQKQAAGYMSRVAHFREANPNPKVASELHTDTVSAVDAVVRKGENPSTAQLPMTSKQFDEIDTVNTRGLSDVQKQTIDNIKTFQRAPIDDEVMQIKSQLDQLKIIAKEGESALAGQQSLLAKIRQLGGISTKSSRAGELRDIFEGGAGAFTIRKNGKDLDVLATDLEEAGFLKGKNNEPADADDLVEALRSGIGKKNVPEELREVRDSLDYLASRGIDENSSLEDIAEVLNNERYINATEANSLIRQLDTDEDLVEEFMASIDTVPSRIEEIPQPLNNSEMDTLLKRLESIDNEKVVNENFRQLLETNADTVITLEDGTTKTLRQLQEEFADDENFLTEISTCAIG